MKSFIYTALLLMGLATIAGCSGTAENAPAVEETTSSEMESSTAEVTEQAATEEAAPAAATEATEQAAAE